MEDFGEAGMSSAASNEVDGAVGTAAEAATISMHQEQQSNVVSTESDDTDLINRLSTEEVRTGSSVLTVNVTKCYLSLYHYFTIEYYPDQKTFCFHDCDCEMLFFLSNCKL